MANHNHKAVPLRWGILSTARVAWNRFLPALLETDSGQAVAIASSRKEKATDLAARFGIERIYADYGDLLADPEVEAVYIPLPNSLHLEWCKKALEAGKHVLCEKPLVMNGAEAHELVDCLATTNAERLRTEQSQLVLAEGFMYRFHPRWQALKNLTEANRFGQILSMHLLMAFHNDNPGNIRNQAGVGGGALLDLGCYGASIARWLYGKEPESVSARLIEERDTGVDVLASILLDFGDGTATITCTTRGSYGQGFHLQGDSASAFMRRPLNPANDEAAVLIIDDGQSERVRRYDPANAFVLQADAFAEAVRGTTPWPFPVIGTPGTDSLGNARILDAVRMSARTRKAVEPESPATW